MFKRSQLSLAVSPLAALVTAALALTQAHAQTNTTAPDGAARTPEPATLPSITVTADKTEKLLDEVPASVLVISGEELEDAGITRFEQLEGRIPSLSFQPFGQSGINSPVMRGLTANFNALSTSTLLLVDGVPTLTAQGFENQFIDLDRIEVLRGPQSTLYGRNAEAGVIALYSRPMGSEPRAMLSAEVGSRNKRATRFAFSRPLVEDTLYASLSGEWMRQDGFIRNTYSGGKADDRERYNVNLGLRWTPQAQTDVVLRYARQQYHDGGAWWASPTAPRKTVASGTPSHNRSIGQTFSLNAAHEISPKLRVRSITAYNDFKDRVPQDTDFTPMEISWVQRDHRLRTVSQEFRLEGLWGEADWLLGLYGDRSNNDLHNVGKRPMFPAFHQYADQKSDTLALFTHWNIPLPSNFSLALGARVERFKARIEPRGFSSQRKKWTHFSPKIALQYQLAENNQVYVSASHGVRNGGFNPLSPMTNFAAFAPEKVWSYELGAKGRLLNQRLRYGIAAYYMDVNNMQVLQMPAPTIAYITSAATATSKGLELDVDYLLGRNWLLQAGVSWNRTRFGRFQDGAANYDGKRNPFAPDLNGYVGLRYDDPSGWYAQTQLTGSSKVYLDAANRYARNGYGLVNVLAGYRHGDWDVTLYANNIANRTYDAVGYQNGFVTVYSPPREVGLRLTWRM